MIIFMLIIFNYFLFRKLGNMFFNLDSYLYPMETTKEDIKKYVVKNYIFILIDIILDLLLLFSMLSINLIIPTYIIQITTITLLYIMLVTNMYKPVIKFYNTNGVFRITINFMQCALLIIFILNLYGNL